MDVQDNKQLKKEIKDIKKLNFTQIILTIKYIINTYIQSLIVFGVDSDITKEVKSIWYEIKKVIKEENSIHQYLINNSAMLELPETLELLDKLDGVNEDTIRYYYNALDDIEEACETKCEYRASHLKKEFYTLSETDEYKIEAVGLTINFENVKEFLGYPEDFWEYINPKITRIDSRNEESKEFFLTLIKTNNEGILEDMKVIVPYVINLHTACVNIREFKHAYDLYIRLGQQIDEKEEHYEQDAKNLEKDFSLNYVLKRFH